MFSDSSSNSIDSADLVAAATAAMSDKVKVCLLGSERTGKSTFIKNLMFDDMDVKNYAPTIGIDFCAKTFDYHGRKVRCQFWDTSGQDRFSSLMPSYIRDSTCILLFYDITDHSSFKHLQTCLDNVRSVTNNSNLFLMANKADLDDEKEVNTSEAENFARKNRMELIELSSLCKTQVNSSFEKILHKLVGGGGGGGGDHSTKTIKLSLRPSARLTGRKKIENSIVSISLDDSRVTNDSSSFSSSTAAAAAAAAGGGGAYHLPSLNHSHRHHAGATAVIGDSESKKSIEEISARLKTCQEHLSKREIELNELNCWKERENLRDIGSARSARIDVIFSAERAFAENSRSELAGLAVKYDLALKELNEEKTRSREKEVEFSEMKRELDALKIEYAAVSQDLKVQKTMNQDHEECIRRLESTVSQQSSKNSLLEKERNDLSNSVEHLESLNKLYLKEKEETQKKFDLFCEKLKILSSKVSVELKTVIPDNIEGIDLLTTKIEEIINFNKLIEEKRIEEKKILTAAEEATKKLQESHDKLVANLNNAEKEITKLKAAMEILQLERDTALHGHTMTKSELAALHERHAKAQDVWVASSKSLDEKEALLADRDQSILALKLEIEMMLKNSSKVLEKIAVLLSDDFVVVAPNEDEVVEKLRLLMYSSKERAIKIQKLECELDELAKELAEKTGLMKQVETKYVEFKMRCQELEDSFKNSENNLNGLLNIREHLDREHCIFRAFISRLNKIVALSQCEAQFSETHLSLLLSHIEKIFTCNKEYERERAENVQLRKISELKELLCSKEINLELLRKKLVDLEEERVCKSDLRRESEERLVKIKKLQVKVDRQNEEIECLKSVLVDLKSQLHDVNCLREKIQDQTHTHNRREKLLSELEESNKCLRLELEEFKSKYDALNLEFKKVQCSQEVSIEMLTKELESFKRELNFTKANEAKLSNFREMIARLLGVTVSQLSVIADYEIIARVEQIIRTLSASVIPIQINATTTTTTFPFH